MMKRGTPTFEERLRIFEYSLLRAIEENEIMTCQGHSQAIEDALVAIIDAEPDAQAAAIEHAWSIFHREYLTPSGDVEDRFCNDVFDTQLRN